MCNSGFGFRHTRSRMAIIIQTCIPGLWTINEKQNIQCKTEDV